MKTYANILLGAAAMVAGAIAVTDTATTPVLAQAQGANVCLHVSDIRSTQAMDNRTIVYRMKNGDIWRNTLAAPCPDLMTHAAGVYTQTMHTDEICANAHTITVATGMVCRLGAFARAN